MKRYLTVYNLAREKDWVLKNAYDIIETREINAVWMLEFSIPMNEADMEHCQPNWYVRYGDDGQLYRFTDQTKTNANESTVTYHCEHVIATLSDDVMFQGPYIKGNTGTYTNQVLNYILGMQTLNNGVRNWKLGVCEPRRQFEYSWENENLLAALWSVPTCFDTPYMWTFDTSTYPWTINLININENADPDFYLMAKKNILQSTEESSNLDICTRLYGLGEGEGVNQLTIKSVNNGLPYIQSAPEIVAKYGIVSRIFVDRRYQYPETLKARMETLLHELEMPTLKREFEIVDLYDMSPDDMYKAEVGEIVLLKDDNTKVYITKTVKNWSVPGDMQITIATKATDMAQSIADLADRQRIEQVYSQGASQVYSFSFFGNATSEYPLDGYVYFPSDLKYLNEVKLKVMLKPFRSYSKATKIADVVMESCENKTVTVKSCENKSVTVKSCENKTVTVKSCENKTVTVKTNSEALTDLKTTESGGGTTSSGGGTSVTVGGGSLTGNTTPETDGHGVSLDVSATGISYAPQETTTSEPNTDMSSGAVWEYTDANVSTANIAKKTGSTTSMTTIGYTFTEGPGSPIEYYDSHMHRLEDIPYHEHIVTITDIQTSVRKKDFSHSHNINHYHTVNVSGSASGGNHSHTFNLPEHTHTITEHSHDLPDLSHSHKIELNGHTHNIELNGHTHNIELNGHTHNIELNGHTHKINLVGHQHDIEPGIFESGNPTKAKILIDDKDINLTITDTNSEVNLTQYLLKNGSVPRGQWIKISVKPSNAAPNNMAYISVFGNTFAYIQSYTGGNY